MEWKAKYPFRFDQKFDGILQQHAISELSHRRRTRDVYYSRRRPASNVGGLPYKFNRPRQWLSSSDLDHGLWSAFAMEFAANPGALVVYIDGDGSFQMNIQELATLYYEKLPVKVLLLNTTWVWSFSGKTVL